MTTLVLLDSPDGFAFPKESRRRVGGVEPKSFAL